MTTPFAEDEEHASYDPVAVQAFWQALRRIEPVFQKFRAGFRGKCSPVHFFWGAFDLAVSRFNGRRAPARKDKVDRDAYDEEVHLARLLAGRPLEGLERGDVLLVHGARARRTSRVSTCDPPQRSSATH